MPSPQEKPSTNPPIFNVIGVREYTGSDGEQRTRFTRLGAAWALPRGGYSLNLDGLPTNDRLLLLPREREVA
jgi:hypothetical protein